MKRIVVIFLAAAALLCSCDSSADTSSQGEMSSSAVQGDTQSGEMDPVQSQTDKQEGDKVPSDSQGDVSDGQTPDEGDEQPDDTLPQDDVDETAQTAQIAQAMLALMEGQGDMNYARLIDMDGDGQEELLLGTNGLDCWAWRWTQEGLSQIALGGPIDRGNDGQMGGITDSVWLVQAQDGTYGVLCQGSTDLDFCTYRFLDRTECYENRVYYEWICSPDFAEDAPDPENYFYRNGENIPKEEFEAENAQYTRLEQISRDFANRSWSGHVRETQEALELLAAA